LANVSQVYLLIRIVGYINIAPSKSEDYMRAACPIAY
jgi:hypothetical protein